MGNQTYMNEERNKSDWVPAILCMLATLAFLMILTFSPKGKTELAVIFPLKTTSDAAFAKTVSAGAYAIGRGGLENIIHITIINKKNSDETIKRLYENGALLIINGSPAGSCFS